jgi:hypothetical protein
MEQNQDFQEPKKKQALDECKRLEESYGSAATGFQWAYFLSQFIAVVFSGITPILILMDNIPKHFQAAPPALASIAAGLSVYNWRLNWTRNKITSESLKNERLNFDMRVTSDYESTLTDEAALGNFRKNVMRFNLEAMNEWQQTILKEDMSNKKTGDSNES